MKAALAFSSFIAAFALVFSFFQQSRIGELQKKVNALEKQNKPVLQDREEKEIPEVVHYMQRMQAFHHKLYFSGMAGNKELLKFYLHELEEEMEAIAEAGIVDDGVEISKNMEIFGIKQVEWFEKELEKKSDFKTTFVTFTSGSCNGCHVASKHSEIKIIVPQNNYFSNQDFSYGK